MPSDVVFRGNNVTRPESWRQERWDVKNLLELKNARRVLIERNVFERHWAGAQAGYAIVMTPRGERGKAPWAVVEDVTFQFNVVRNIAAAINISGHDDAGPSGLAQRIRILNNQFYSFDQARWGGNGFFLLIGNGPMHIVVDHNTIIQRGDIVSAYGGSASDPTPIEDFTFTNNLTLHNANGVHGQGRAVGQDTLDTFFPDAVFTRNVIAGGRASRYPAGNEFPTEAEFARQFVDFAAQDYRLASSTPYKLGGTDRHDLGADISGLRARRPAATPIERVHRRSLATAAIVRGVRATDRRRRMDDPTGRTLWLSGLPQPSDSLIPAHVRTRAVQ